MWLGLVFFLMAADFPPHDDPLGLVFGSLGFGLTFGLAFQSVVAFVVRTLQARQPLADGPPNLAAPSALVLLLGTFLGALAAAAATWTVLARFQNPWRQGVLAMVAAFGSLVLALVAMPVDRVFGRAGLLVLALGAGFTSWLIFRRLRVPS
jgi:hypothetical protein